MKTDQEELRLQERLRLFSTTKQLHKYAFSETIAIMLIYFTVGYLIDPQDACLIHSRIPFLLIILTIITLFHGFQSGILAILMSAVAMWFSYPLFPYEEFLIILMMTLIFGEFHYYWTRRIHEAETDSSYKNIKLNELSKAFYTLKISHDQLEKNYVIKPMSLRNSIKTIRESRSDDAAYHQNFLSLLDKAFNVHKASIVKKNEDAFVTIATTSGSIQEVDEQDPLIENALRYNKPVYINEEADKKSDYIAVLPAPREGSVEGMLLVEKIPFMSFNKENLTSIAILFDYFFNEMYKISVLRDDTLLQPIQDNDFRFEVSRLHKIYKTYHINSAVLALKIYDELTAERLYENVKKILRSLDLSVRVINENATFILILFPFADKAVCNGFAKRLFGNFKDLDEKEIEQMTFDLAKTNLLNLYIGGKNE